MRPTGVEVPASALNSPTPPGQQESPTSPPSGALQPATMYQFPEDTTSCMMDLSSSPSWSTLSEAEPLTPWSPALDEFSGQTLDQVQPGTETYGQYDDLWPGLWDVDHNQPLTYDQQAESMSFSSENTLLMLPIPPGGSLDAAVSHGPDMFPADDAAWSKTQPGVSDWGGQVVSSPPEHQRVEGHLPETPRSGNPEAHAVQNKKYRCDECQKAFAKPEGVRYVSAGCLAGGSWKDSMPPKPPSLLQV